MSTSVRATDPTRKRPGDDASAVIIKRKRAEEATATPGQLASSSRDGLPPPPEGPVPAAEGPTSAEPATSIGDAPQPEAADAHGPESDSDAKYEEEAPEFDSEAEDEEEEDAPQPDEEKEPCYGPQKTSIRWSCGKKHILLNTLTDGTGERCVLSVEDNGRVGVDSEGNPTDFPGLDPPEALYEGWGPRVAIIPRAGARPEGRVYLPVIKNMRPGLVELAAALMDNNYHWFCAVPLLLTPEGERPLQVCATVPDNTASGMRAVPGTCSALLNGYNGFRLLPDSGRETKSAGKFPQWRSGVYHLAVTDPTFRASRFQRGSHRTNNVRHVEARAAGNGKRAAPEHYVVEACIGIVALFTGNDALADLIGVLIGFLDLGPVRIMRAKGGYVGVATFAPSFTKRDRARNLAANHQWLKGSSGNSLNPVLMMKNLNSASPTEAPPQSKKAKKQARNRPVSDWNLSGAFDDLGV